MNSSNIKEMGRLMLGYLPATYRMDPESEAFLELYLGIFGSEIITMEELIADIPRYFDPEALTDEEEEKKFLTWLTGWLSLDLFSQYSIRNREYLLMACQFYRTKGTQTGLIALLEFITDGKAYVQDRSDLIFRTFHPDLYDEYHTKSLTLDTTNTSLLQRMYKYGDKVHYIYGGEIYVIGAYLVELKGTADEIEQKKEVLKKLVEPFVPAFYSVEINTMD